MLGSGFAAYPPATIGASVLARWKTEQPRTTVDGWTTAFSDSNGLTFAQLLALNPGLDETCVIHPGQVLCLKKDTCTVTSTSTASGTEYEE